MPQKKKVPLFIWNEKQTHAYNLRWIKVIQTFQRSDGWGVAAHIDGGWHTLISGLLLEEKAREHLERLLDHKIR